MQRGNTHEARKVLTNNMNEGILLLTDKTLKVIGVETS